MRAVDHEPPGGGQPLRDPNARAAVSRQPAENRRVEAPAAVRCAPEAEVEYQPSCAPQCKTDAPSERTSGTSPAATAAGSAIELAPPDAGRRLDRPSANRPAKVGGWRASQ